MGYNRRRCIEPLDGSSHWIAFGSSRIGTSASYWWIAASCTADEVATIADLLPEFVTREPLGSLLLLGDFTGAQFSREAVEHIKIAAVFDRPHLKRSAWVLTENLPKVFYDSIRSFSARQIPTFATRRGSDGIFGELRRRPGCGCRRCRDSSNSLSSKIIHHGDTEFLFCRVFCDLGNSVAIWLYEGHLTLRPPTLCLISAPVAAVTGLVRE